MLSKSRATSSSSNLFRLVAPVLLACAAALASAQSGNVAARSSECTASTEMHRAIEADFYACLLRGLTQGSHHATVEDECASKYIAALETDQNAAADPPLDAEFRNDSWWVEY